MKLTCNFVEKLLSKRSRASPAPDDAAQEDTHPSADVGTVAELHQQIEELATQNSELVLKVQVKPIPQAHA